MVRGLNWLTGKGRQEKRSGERPSPDVTPPRTVAEDGWRPAQTGRSLLQADEHRRLIRVLTENSPLSQQVTEAWWLRPLEEMAGRVQACPAAWSGPFSGPGGFNELSLNVATRAVRLVRGMMLPPGATPEEQAEQTPGWVCAAYWAGLFHHLPWLMQVEGALKSGRVWYPGLSVPGEPWRVRPASEPSGEMGSVYVALRLLPEAALLWLQRWPALSDTLLLFLSGRRAEAGILNSIVNDALRSCSLSDTAMMPGQASHRGSPETAAVVTDRTTQNYMKLMLYHCPVTIILRMLQFQLKPEICPTVSVRTGRERPLNLSRQHRHCYWNPPSQLMNRCFLQKTTSVRAEKARRRPPRRTCCHYWI